VIQLSGAGKRFGHKLLFENLNWLITSKDRAGLVGANGTGKTTLLKILAGIETLEYGSLSVTRGTSSGYLASRRPYRYRAAVSSRECMSVFASLQRDGAGNGSADPQDGRARSFWRRIRTGGRSIS
jgi:ATP-binding cassette subfamily F protein 3